MTSAPPTRVARRVWRAFEVLVAGVGACWLFCGVVYALGVRVNLTPSMPLGLYGRDTSPIRVGAIVSGCLPAQVAAIGRDRGYLLPGYCPGGVVPVVKRVAVLGPGVVTVTNRGVYVDNERVGGPPLTVDHAGRAVTPVGRVVVPRGSAFLLGESADSWDSRYFGPVPLPGWEARRVIFAW